MWIEFGLGVVSGMLLLLFIQKVLYPSFISIRKYIRKNRKKIYRIIWTIVVLSLISIVVYLSVREKLLSSVPVE